jgi:hypothetical protein
MLALALALSSAAPNTGVGVPGRALLIGGVPLQVDGRFLLIGV